LTTVPVLPTVLLFGSATAMIVLTFVLGYALGRQVRSPTSPRQSREETKKPRTEHEPVAGSPEPFIISPPSIVTRETAGSREQLLHQRLGALDLSTVDIQHTADWDRAVELAEGKARCLFITGVAGTGKSTLLRYFVTTTDKRVVVLAPTGVAALNVGGQTIHSFFRFPPGPVDNVESVPMRGELFKSLDAVVVDEISMVRADLMDAVDESLRINRGNAEDPFGGAQMIFIGDLFQLQPVVREREEGRYFSQYYESPFFFDASVFSSVAISLYKLKTVYRQTDPTFMEILNRIRVNRMTGDDLRTLNTRVDPAFEPPPDSGYIELTTTNRMAEIKNSAELQKLSLPERVYIAVVTGEFKGRQYPTDMNLRLRQGAQVIMLNNDPGRRWVNGTIALIQELGEHTVTIRIPTPLRQPDRLCEVGVYTWDISKYRINHDTGKLESEVVGSFTQLPLRLAWAITIHKSQGKTLDRAIIDMSKGTFAHGQAYVALSRCATLEGLVLRAPLRPRDVKVDPRVFRFMDGIRRNTIRVQ
jgi:ATP-dependent DNA helicase PIF1